MATSIRIRMYRSGFGDCFLVTYGAGAAMQHMLIDFGAHMHGEIGTMDRIMENLETTTNSKLEVIVATHAHRDHISGFGKFAARFGRFKIGEVWLPWTDDPHDKQASSLKRKHLALYDNLDTWLNGVTAAAQGPRYAAALDALMNLRGNETANSELARGFGTGATVRYLGAGTSIAKVADIAGLSAEVLAPSRDRAFLSRMNPPANQQFFATPGDPAGAVHPFPKLEIRKDDNDYAAIVTENQPVLTDEELGTLEELAAAPADSLALALDNMRNNTSLVILFRFRGKNLLFPGDAQWGNWQSWISTVTGRELLRDLDFLKIAHHGSENATPVDVVHALKDAGVAAMVSTQIKPFPTIPRLPLIKELEKHCIEHMAVRSDWIDVDGAVKGPSPQGKLPKGFKMGELWIDYQL